MGARARWMGGLALALVAVGCGEPPRRDARGAAPRAPPAVPSDRRGQAAAHAHVEQMREATFRAAALAPGMTAADIGCGGGWFALRAARAVGSAGRVYATDVDRTAVTSLRQRVAHMEPGAAPIDVRLCRDERDTALDDLPDDRIDVVFMVDSLCFDATESHARNVAYLRRLLRKLRPGGRLVHHMDCNCDVASAALDALFEEAGFSPHVEQVAFRQPRASVPADRCRTEAARERHWLAPIYRKLGG